MKNLNLIVPLLLLNVCFSYAQDAKINEHQKIHFLTEPLPPISYPSPDRREIFGIGVDIIGHIAKSFGHDYKNHAKKQGINIMPWKKAYNIIQNHDNYALFPMLRTQNREKLFKWVGPLVNLDAYFYRSKNAPDFIKNITSLEKMNNDKVRIGVVEGYPTHLKLNDLKYKNIFAFGRTSDAMSALRIDRIHFVNNGELFYPFRLAKMGFDAKDFVKTNILTFSSSQYIAFSKNTPDHIIIQWQKALDEMKKTRLYDKIYEKALRQAIEIYQVVPKNKVNEYVKKVMRGIKDEK